jgi:hypothetical protein
MVFITIKPQAFPYRLPSEPSPSRRIGLAEWGSEDKVHKTPGFSLQLLGSQVTCRGLAPMFLAVSCPEIDLAGAGSVILTTQDTMVEDI